MTTDDPTEPTEPAPDLVRREVLEAQAMGRGISKVDVSRRSRAPLGFLALLLVVAGVVWLSLMIEVDQSSVGRGRVVRGRSLVAAFPIGTQSSLEPGLPVQFRVDDVDVRAYIVSVETPLAADDAERLVGNLPETAQAFAIVRANLIAGGLRGRTGSVTIKLARLRLWDVVAPGRVLHLEERRG